MLRILVQNKLNFQIKTAAGKTRRLGLHRLKVAVFFIKDIKAAFVLPRLPGLVFAVEMDDTGVLFNPVEVNALAA